jgi:homospermidine synthase
MNIKNLYYPDFKSRIDFIKSLKNSRDMKGRKICIFGCGGMGKITVYWLDYFFTNTDITIYDKEDEKLNFIRKYYPKIKAIHREIVKSNFIKSTDFLKKGDIIIDAAYNIDTKSLYKFCNDNGILYLNSAIECWDFQAIKSPLEYTLFWRNEQLEKFSKKNDNNTNFIVTMGCNPGNVSLWAKYGLYLLAKKKGIKIDENKSEKEIFPELSKKLGVQVIHICEHDTQLINNPRKKGEYVNTWSSDPDSFYEEFLGPIELSWGTHEKKYPDSTFVKINNKNDRVILLKEIGMNNFMRSYTPISGMYFGMSIRHEENLSLGKYLSISSADKITYQPSTYYVYKPTSACLEDVQETRENNLKWGTKKRFLTNEIVEGRNELGVSLFMKNGDVWWIGSLLDIDETRKLYAKWMNNYINATNTQVVGGNITGIFYILDLWDKGETKGLLYPEDIPLEYLKINLAFQGDFVLEKAKWNNDKMPFEFGDKPKQKSWMFDDFRVKL